VLSFTEYGSMEGFRYYHRMIRLFGSRSPYYNFTNDLKAVALDPASWENFISKIRL